MYDIKKPFQFHIELTDKCNARCPSCARKKINNDGSLTIAESVKGNEITIDTFKKRFSSWDKPIYDMFFCGNYGDPILAKDFLDIIEYTKTAIKPDKITVHTNGGVRSTGWWKTLAGILKEQNHYVEFGIEGVTQEIHSRYRVGTSINKIFNNAKAFIEAGGCATWKMVVHKHNEDQVDICEKTAKDMGFSGFSIEPSTRLEAPLNYVFKGSNYSLEKTTKYTNSNIPTKEIDCYSAKKNSIYIAADSNVHVCCWLASLSSQHLPNRIVNRPSNDLPLINCAINKWSMKTLPKSFKTNPNFRCIEICQKKTGQNLDNHGIKTKISK